ncbi:hypothetical protein AD998_08655 [bacterium 336/3]|nr:hypothetical protein AD998_08655 [bacterium 336/3]
MTMKKQLSSLIQKIQWIVCLYLGISMTSHGQTIVMNSSPLTVCKGATNVPVTFTLTEDIVDRFKDYNTTNGEQLLVLSLPTGITFSEPTAETPLTATTADGIVFRIERVSGNTKLNIWYEEDDINTAGEQDGIDIVTINAKIDISNAIADGTYNIIVSQADNEAYPSIVDGTTSAGAIKIDPAPAPVTFKYYTVKENITPAVFQCQPISGCIPGGGGCITREVGGIPICAVKAILRSAIVYVVGASCSPSGPFCDECEECVEITPASTSYSLEPIVSDVCPGTQIYVKIDVNGQTSPTGDNIQRQLIINNGTPLNPTGCPDGSNGCFALNNLVSTDVLKAQLTTTTGAGCTYTITPTVSNPPVQNIPIGVLKAKDLSNTAVTYNVPLYGDPALIPTDSILVFGNFESTEFRFKDGTTDLPKTQYNFGGMSGFVQDASNPAWLLNPGGLNLDFVYTVEFRDTRCSSPSKYFKFKLFDNSPKQLIGLTNGGVCKDINKDIDIGWIGQGAVGYLSCIREVNSAEGFIKNGLDPNYKNRKGINSGFQIDFTKVNATSRTSFDVEISYYVCSGANVPDGSLTNCTSGPVSNGEPQPCILKTSKERIVISNPAPEQITILGADPIKPVYCEGSPSITLVGTPINAEGGSNKLFSIETLIPTPSTPRFLTATTTLEFREFNTGETAINAPNVLEPGKSYRINYTYTNKYGCGQKVTYDISVEQLPNPIDPVATQTTQMFCLNSAIPRIKIAGYETNIVRWYSATGSFLYEDTGGVNTGFNSLINSAISADYDYQVSIVSATPQKCESSKTPFRISVGEPIMPKFSFTRVCEGTQVQFTNEAILPSAPDRNTVDSLIWDFGDPTSSTNTSNLENPTHLYQNAGIYKVRCTIITKAGCNNFIEKQVIVHKKAQLVGGVYNEDFENVNLSDPTPFPNTLDWTSSSNTESLNQDSKKSSWKIISVNRMDGTTGQAFVTSNTNNTYNDSEYSWIESPCFDLSVLNAPLMNIKMRYNTDFKADGAFVMYTTNNGTSWNLLGNLNQGSEWYNSGDILGFSSITGVNNSNRIGWSGKSNDFIEAKLSLRDVKTALNSLPANTPVRFRIVFASNADNPANNSFTGVAIDRVVILDKNHRVLLEHFTNTTSPAHQDADWTSFVNNGQAKTDLVHVQYHTTFPTGDALGQASRPESNARSLHYAVGQPPYTVVDGRMEAGKQFYPRWNYNVTNSEAYNYYLQRSLVASTFSIGTPIFSGGTGGNPLQVKVNISRTNAPSDKTSAVMAHLMIVQNDANGNKNVVRKMLPSPAGTRLESMWASGSSYTLEGSWKPSNAVAANTYSVVVFIADEKTKEIYQADIFPINQSIDAKTVEKSVTMDAEEINLYPNPTSTDVTVVLPETPTGKVTWRMFDALGREVEGGSGTTDNALFRVTTQNCNKGIYIIEISTSDWKVRKSVSVIK